MKRTALCLVLCLAALSATAAAQEGSAPPPDPGAAAPAATPRPDDPAPAAPPPSASPIWVSTEVRFPNYFSSLFYAFYTGDRVDTRVLIHNTGQEEIELPKGLDLLRELRVTSSGGKRLDPGSPPAAANSLPSRIGPGQILGGLYDLSDAFPGLGEPDTYTIQWESGEWKSNPVGVRIIPRYNPDADYDATLETEAGKITIAFHGVEAPVHVRNFVNLAHLGYYDGMPFHTTARDRSIRAGAPGPDGTGAIGYFLPPEIATSLKHVAGAVSMYRDQRFPGNDSDGSQFFICLTDIPNRDGKFTVFGKVSEGLEVAKKISERETVTDPKRPAGTPREPVKILRVVVREKPRAARG